MTEQDERNYHSFTLAKPMGIVFEVRPERPLPPLFQLFLHPVASSGPARAPLSMRLRPIKMWSSPAPTIPCVNKENEPSIGGVFVESLAEGGAAAALVNPPLAGDQLVVIGDTCCKGMDFDSSLDLIRESPLPNLTVVRFRGSATDLYGNRGASTEWMSAVVDKLSRSGGTLSS